MCGAGAFGGQTNAFTGGRRAPRWAGCPGFDWDWRISSQRTDPEISVTMAAGTGLYTSMGILFAQRCG